MLSIIHLCRATFDQLLSLALFYVVVLMSNCAYFFYMCNENFFGSHTFFIYISSRFNFHHHYHLTCLRIKYVCTRISMAPSLLLQSCTEMNNLLNYFICVLIFSVFFFNTRSASGALIKVRKLFEIYLMNGNFVFCIPDHM